MSLIHWWPLTKDAKDIVGGSDLEGVYVYDSNGKIGGCALEYGTRLHASSERLGSSTKCSISMWVKFSSITTSTAQSCLLQIPIKRGSTNNAGSFVIQLDSDTVFKARFRDLTTSASLSLGFEFDKWHHLVLIIDTDSVVDIYIDNDYKGYCTWPRLGNCRIQGDIYLSDGGFYAGYSDVKVYNHILSKKEIYELSKGLIVDYSFNDISVNANLFDMSKYINCHCNRSTAVISGENGFTLTSTGSDPYIGGAYSAGSSTGLAITFPVVAGRTYYLSWDHVSGPELNKNYASFFGSDNKAVTGYSTLGSPSVEGTRRYEVLTAPAGATQIHIRFGNQSLGSGSSLSVSRICLSESNTKQYVTPGTFAQVADNSGHGYNAAVHGNTTVTSDTVRGLYGLHTPGTPNTTDKSLCSYICGDLGGNLYPTAFTISMWAKVNAFGIQDSGILSLNSSDSAYNHQTSTFVQYDHNFRLCQLNSNNESQISYEMIRLNTWCHYAFVWNGVRIIAYVNGEKYADVLSTWNVDPFRYIFLGFDQAGGAGRNADVIWGEFKLYSTAFSNREILDLYYSSRWAANREGQVFSNVLNEGQSKFQITKNGVNNCNTLSEFPESFELLDYVEATSDRMIDTGVAFDPNVDGVEFKYSAAVAQANYFIAGCGSTGLSHPYLWLYHYTGVSGFNAYVSDTSNSQVGIAGYRGMDTNPHVIKYNAKKLYCDGTQTGSTTASLNTSMGNLKLFNTATNNATYATRGKIYYCKVWKNGQLVRDMFPAKRVRDNATGFIDAITGQFFTDNETPLSSVTVRQSRDGSLYCAEFNEI